MIDLKDAKTYKRSKATVERYVRKAKMYYGSNLKVQKLLAEVEIEMSVAEKKAKSQARIIMLKAIITNKWFWSSVVLVVGLLTALVGHLTNDEGVQLGGLELAIVSFLMFLISLCSVVKDY